jgi:uncharacterized protein (TIGR00375 family)
MGAGFMRIIADLHIHSHFSRATSEQMNIQQIAKFAKIKGLNVVGTGDFTHPGWLKEIRTSLVKEEQTGLFNIAASGGSKVRFMLTTEVCTIFEFASETRKIHHVILSPDLETVYQINEELKKHGDLQSDGRPILSMSAPHLVEEVMQISSENMVFPAHAWTPWFSVFGAFSGFNTVDDCYQDMTKHVHALETGLSSDPPMNWRLSNLDRFTLVSNSDSHSPWPWRIGREANVFELKQVSYHEILDTIRTKDPSRLKFTIETDPAYGKYHWTGHRNCNVSLSPRDAQKLGNICPVCHRELTKGVEQRVEELADRPFNFKPDGVPSFIRLLPLSEIISTVLTTDSPSTQAVWKIYNALIDKFGNEFTVLMDTPKNSLTEVATEEVADAILRVRNGSAAVVPGFDGVYGKLVLGTDIATEHKRLGRIQQSNLADFW